MSKDIYVYSPAILTPWFESEYKRDILNSPRFAGTAGERRECSLTRSDPTLFQLSQLKLNYTEYKFGFSCLNFGKR